MSRASVVVTETTPECRLAIRSHTSVRAAWMLLQPRLPAGRVGKLDDLHGRRSLRPDRAGGAGKGGGYDPRPGTRFSGWRRPRRHRHNGGLCVGKRKQQGEGQEKPARPKKVVAYTTLFPEESVVMAATPGIVANFHKHVVTLGMYELWRRRNTAIVTDKRIMFGSGIVRRSEKSIPLVEGDRRQLQPEGPQLVRRGHRHRPGPAQEPAGGPDVGQGSPPLRERDPQPNVGRRPLTPSPREQRGPRRRAGPPTSGRSGGRPGARGSAIRSISAPASPASPPTPRRPGGGRRSPRFPRRPAATPRRRDRPPAGSAARRRWIGRSTAGTRQG